MGISALGRINLAKLFKQGRSTPTSLKSLPRKDRREIESAWKRARCTKSHDDFNAFRELLESKSGLWEPSPVDFRKVDVSGLYDFVKRKTSEHRRFLDLPKILSGQEIELPFWFLSPPVHSLSWARSDASDLLALLYIDNRLINYITETPRVYYVGLGGSARDDKKDLAGGTFDLLCPLIFTGFSELVGVECVDVSFEKFVHLTRHELRELRDANGRLVTESLRFTREGEKKYSAVFEFLGKERSVVAYYDFVAGEKHPPEIEEGYDIEIGAAYNSGFGVLMDKTKGLVLVEGDVFPYLEDNRTFPYWWEFSPGLLYCKEIPIGVATALICPIDTTCEDAMYPPPHGRQWVEVNSLSHFSLSLRDSFASTFGRGIKGYNIMPLPRSYFSYLVSPEAAEKLIKIEAQL